MTGSARDVVDGFMRGDVSLLADDAEIWLAAFVPTPDHPGTRGGVTAKVHLLAMMKAINAGAQERFRIVPTAWVVEGSRVAVEAEGHVVTKAGATYENRYHFAFVVRDGLIVELREYSDTRLVAETFEHHANVLMVAFTSPVEGLEDEFNDWYDNQHLEDLLNIPGVLSAKRYRLSAQQAAPHKTPPQPYLAVYELDPARLDEAMAELVARGGTDLMPISESVVIRGAGKPIAYVYEPVEKITR